MNASKYLEEDKKFALENCKMLYQDVKKPCTETCACWGFQFGPGWNSVIKNLSAQLELLNYMFYPKYGIHIVMDEAKQKFGELRFYFSVRIKQPIIYRMWHLPFEKLYNLIRYNVDFKMKKIVDEPSYYSDEKEPIPEGKFEEVKKSCERISNIKFERDAEGHWFKVTHLWHMEKMHMVPTRLKLLYHFMNLMWKLNCRLTIYSEPSRKQRVVAEAVQNMADKLVHEAEEECYCHCEDCGTQIGTEWSPRVTTKGWIMNICENCDNIRTINNIASEIDYLVSHKNAKIDIDDENAIDAMKKKVNGNDYVYTKESKDMRTKAEEILNKVEATAEKDEEETK